MDAGTYRISSRDWILMWQEACPEHRVGHPSLQSSARLNKQSRTHCSFLAKRANLQNEGRLDRLIKYCTKWATPRNVQEDFNRLLKKPEAFLYWMDSLKGVTRFFGTLHR
ncbi:hypothetical protein [Acidipila sp. EB88]|uniref:hypothetical protein n=1 Tax=Acidipila sp. EB88 TaxID=2305226 RepID=UPI000F5F8AAE|nr:hypothetical protein [Acidipila sp. EB88]RRA49332.1 hypothetical protein D1Y84_14655 [Acidipila sp. EB88]